MYCGLCYDLMYSSVVKYGITYWCPDMGGCGHVRIRGLELERLVHELIAQSQRRRPALVETDPVLVALRTQTNQLQDDHYDRLLDRVDFLRQGDRLRQRMSDRRREITAGYPGRAITHIARTAGMEDPGHVRREVLHRHLDRIVVHPHPKPTKPPPDWPGRAAQMLRRLDLYWQNGEQDRCADLPALPQLCTSAVQPAAAGWSAPR